MAEPWFLLLTSHLEGTQQAKLHQALLFSRFFSWCSYNNLLCKILHWLFPSRFEELHQIIFWLFKSLLHLHLKSHCLFLKPWMSGLKIVVKKKIVVPLNWHHITMQNALSYKTQSGKLLTSIKSKKRQHHQVFPFFFLTYRSFQLLWNRCLPSMRKGTLWSVIFTFFCIFRYRQCIWALRKCLLISLSKAKDWAPDSDR